MAQKQLLSIECKFCHELNCPDREEHEKFDAEVQAAYNSYMQRKLGVT